jgi:hypothetical protein
MRLCETTNGEGVDCIDDKIYVMIAAYRDPELVPTIRDCLAKAAHPERLTFGICWQHTKDATADTHDSWDADFAEYKDRPEFRVMDVAWQDSRGACWARHNVQKQWSGERYCLQLDSHHRFVEGWDEILVEMLSTLSQTGSKKPIITAYACPYTPGKPLRPETGPYRMDCHFSGDIILFTPSVIINYEKFERPFPARFTSGHFLFTYGFHCRDCLYDPELYFTGEEISLTVRSFTHGYDLFHPHRVVIYHEYTREGRTKHWDDFNDTKKTTGTIKQTWGELDGPSKNRVRRLLGQLPPDAEDENTPYGLGTERTLKEYEDYAGINFKKCLLHPETIKGTPPPICDANYDWVVQNKHYSFVIDIPRLNMTDILFLYVGVEDDHGNNLFRKDLVNWVDKMSIELHTHFRPTKWILWPHAKPPGGWERKLEFPLRL